VFSLYPTTPFSFFPPATSISAGYTTRMMSVGVATYSSQRIHQTYLSTVMLLALNGQYMSDYATTNPKEEARGAIPYQLYKLYVTTFSTPDGDVPYKPGDYFYPNSNCIGLTTGTSYPIRGVMPNAVYTELVIEKKW
jgi:hypothetical protein